MPSRKGHGVALWTQGHGVRFPLPAQLIYALNHCSTEIYSNDRPIACCTAAAGARAFRYKYQYMEHLL
jgi:hypothetical protein